MADERRKLPAPDAIRHLASATSVYRTMVQDALTLVEEAMAEHPGAIEDYLEIQDHMKILLDPSEVGSLAAVLRCCQALLGEATR